MTKGLQWFVGIDWGRTEHRVCVLAGDGTLVGERRVAHTGAALAALVQWLHTLAVGALDQVGVLLEVPEGPVVETLRGAGCRVFALSPAQMTGLRAQVSVAGAKDDRRDARVLAGTLRTLPHVPRPVPLLSAARVHVRDHSRALQELTTHQTRLVHRWSHQLARYYPQFLAVAPALDRPWVWALWQRVPTPAAAHRVTRRQVAAVLTRHRAHQDAATVLAQLRAPGVAVAPGVAAGAVARIEALLPQLALVVTQARTYARRLPALTAAALADTPGPPGAPAVATVVRSLPGAGPRITAILVAEAAEALVTADYTRLRLAGGTAPVTTQSGQHRRVHRRLAHNHRLGDALFHLARGAAQRDPRWRAAYTAARARGHTHARALRGIADRLLAILCALLRARTLYDPHHPRRGTPAAHAA